jgi:uncharacterized CHY-type Zn-finger protein
MDSSVAPKDEIWFLRVCHHISNAVYFKIPLFVPGNPDILICGNCREMFTELQELLDHKKTYCKLRFTCKCHALNGVKTSKYNEVTLRAITQALCRSAY